MVDIILDTNIWISQITKDKPAGIFELFKKQVEDNDIYLLINDIIIDEWNRNRDNTIEDISKAIKETSKNALKIKEFLDEDGKQKITELLQNYNSIEAERIELAKHRVVEVEKLMATATKIEVTNEMKIRVADWALEKRAPFTQKANSVGDALILLSAVEHRKNYESFQYVPKGFFISFNHTDYADKKDINEIHEDLADLLEEANLEYKRNIGEALNLTFDLIMEIESYIDMQTEMYIEQQREIHHGK